MSIIQEGTVNPEDFPIAPVVDVYVNGDVFTDVAERPVLPEELCGATDSPSLILRARQMVAQRYLRRRYITPDEVGEDGTIRDDAPHSHSTYYVDRLTAEEDTPVVATLRKIRWDPEKGDKSFPLWAHKDKLNPEAVGVIEGIGLENCVEVSALVKSPKLDKDHMATLRLYRALLHDSLKEYAQNGKEETYLMATSPQLFEMFKGSFNGYINRIGDDLDYPGQEVVPAIIRPRDGMLDAIKTMGDPNFDNPQLEFTINFLIDGIDKDTVDPEVASALEAAEEQRKAKLVRSIGEAACEDATDETAGRVKEYIKRRKPEVVAAAGLIGYTILRTVGVAKGVSPDTEVDWRIFLGIEVATTPTYVKGMGDLLRSTVKPEDYTKRQKIGAAALAGGSFIAPYAYVLGEGADMPKTALAGVVAVLGASAASVVAKIRKARKERNQAEQSEPTLESDEQ